MKNLVSNFEYLLLLFFLTASQVLKFGAPSRYYKGAVTWMEIFFQNESYGVKMDETFSAPNNLTKSASS